MTPKSGWRTEDVTFEAKTRPAAAAIGEWLSVTKNGISAGMTPWLTSSQRCPAESRATARRFIGTRDSGLGILKPGGRTEGRRGDRVTELLHISHSPSSILSSQFLRRRARS